MFFGPYPELALSGHARRAYCLRRGEARYHHENDVPAYFWHGIDVAPGDVVIDVGANIGLFALAALARAGGEAAVYAFEPVPPARRVLRLNAERFGDGRLKVFPFGLSRRSGVLAFSYFPRLATARSAAAFDRYAPPPPEEDFRASLRADLEIGRRPSLVGRLPAPLRKPAASALASWLTRTKVVCGEVRTLSEVLHELRLERVDLLKVDATGAELDVLEGIATTDWPRLRQIVVRLDRFSERAADLVALMEMRGCERIRLEQFGNARRGNDVGMIYAATGAPARAPRAADGTARQGVTVPVTSMESS